jgi:type IV secretory pathway VirB10-like protein
MTNDNEPGTRGSKHDPHSLELRARPRPVARFRRSVIVGLTVLGATAIIAMAWWALDAARLKPWPVGEDLLKEGRPSAEGLGTLPESYEDLKPVPELGPPLPGDLGPPLLEKEREYGIAPAGPLPADPDAEAARAERLRLAQQARQARESDVFVQLRQQGQAAGLNASADRNEAGAPSEISALPDEREDAGPQRRKRDFLTNVQGGSTQNAHTLRAPLSPYEVLAGTVISASLITGLNSDLPGRVLAQVTEHVYDTATGRFVLIPQGTRIVGSYDSDIAYGQSRALVIWERLILPNGKSLAIETLPATDTEGYTGLADAVDYHTWSLIKGIALSTLLNVGSELTLGSDENELLRALGRSGQQSIESAGDMIVRRELGVQPTITVRPGWPLRIIVHKDLMLEPYEG